MNKERLVALASTEEDSLDNVIRPKRLKDYIGQEVVKEQLDIFIQACLARNEPLDHVLIFGPPGLGKTTLAGVIATELGVKMRQTSGPVLEKAGDLAAILTNLETNDILFIDEIHRLSPVIEEILYPAMEDCHLDIIIGEGPSARSIKLNLPPFTLIGATTKAGLLTSPLRDRFGIIQRLEFYQKEELAQIVNRSASILNIDIDAPGALEIAKRSRGTPRIANRLLRRIRDFAQIKSSGKVTQAVADAALTLLGIDRVGFDFLDRKLLNTMLEKFEGGPVGLETLAAILGEEKGTIEEVIEPYLLQQGYLLRTARGRMVTELVSQHLRKGLDLKE